MCLWPSGDGGHTLALGDSGGIVTLVTLTTAGDALRKVVAKTLAWDANPVLSLCAVEKKSRVSI